MKTDAASNSSSSLFVALAGMAALAVAMGVGRFAFTPLLPMMQRDTGLSLTDGGWLAAANYLGYLLGALSAVWIRVTPTVMIRAGMCMTAALTFAMGLTHALPGWLILRGLGGVASAWALVYTSTWALSLLARRGQAGRRGLVFSGVGAGIVVTGLLCLELVVRDVSSAKVWMLLGGLAAALSVFVWSMAVQEQADAPEAAKPEAQTRFAWSGATRVFVACYGVFGFGYIIPATFLPVIARQAIHAPKVIGLFWPAFGVAAFFSTLLASSLSNKLDDRRILIGSYGLQAAGVAALAVSPTILGTALCALLVGGTFMVITMQGLREARRIAGPNTSGLMGAMTAAFATGQIIGPVYASRLVLWTGGFTASLLTAAVLMAGSAVALLLSGSSGSVQQGQDDRSE